MEAASEAVEAVEELEVGLVAVAEATDAVAD